MTEFYNLKPGTKLSPQYKIKAFLGRGFEGEVYKIEEKGTGIIRAAKLFYARKNSEKDMHNYAKKLYKLRNCPVIIHYYHQDRLLLSDKKQLNFLVSDFVDGQMLSEFLSQQPGKRLRPFEALHLFNALAEGVAEIHKINEYHGDIHSDNIMLKRKGLGYEVRLIDLLHLGRSSKEQRQQDVFHLIDVLYEMIGGARHYKSMPSHIKKLILGRKPSLIMRQFKTAKCITRYLCSIQL